MNQPLIAQGNTREVSKQEEAPESRETTKKRKSLYPPSGN
jgi:hypothetical protein